MSRDQTLLLQSGGGMGAGMRKENYKGKYSIRLRKMFEIEEHRR